MSDRPTLAPWRALLFALPLGTVLFALVELTRLPVHAHQGDPARVAGALLHLFVGAALRFAVPASLCVGAALLYLWIEKRPIHARWARAGLIGLGVAQSAWARELLIEYAPFAWSLAATLAHVVLAAALSLALIALSRRTLPRALALSLGLATTIASLGLARFHYLVLVGLYPTLHAAVVIVAFCGVCLGLAAVLRVFPRTAGTQRGVVLATAAAILIALLGAPSGGYAWARPYVIAYTELGRAAGVAEAMRRFEHELWPAAPARRDPAGPMRPDDRALERFAARAPALDADTSSLDVLVVLSDATRYDMTLGAGARGPTPALAALARRSVVFEHAIAPSNGTFPSVASMMAMAPVSQAELDVRQRFWQGRLRDERQTVAEAMRAAGRATFWVGHDHKSCFSDAIAGLEQGFERRRLVPQEPGRDEDADARIAELAIEEIARARASGRRFFGLVFFVSPHDDYQGHEELPDAAGDRERYTSELRYMDAQLARVLAAIDPGRTIVVFAGDHGEAFGEHGYDHHLTSLHTEQVRVPLVVRVPGTAPARVTTPFSTAYALPWLMLRGAPAERAAAEQALREDIGPMLRETEGAVLSEMIGQSRQEAVLAMDDYVVHYDLFADLLRIYDRAADPREERDLREERPDLVQRFAPLVARYRAARFAGQRFRFVDTQDR